MAKDWIQITKERVARLDTQIHDAELLGFAIRQNRRLVRMEVQLVNMNGPCGRLQLQFLEVRVLRSGPMGMQNVFGGIGLSTVAALPENERQELFSFGKPEDGPVFTLETCTEMWLQIACETGWTREMTR
jgi:hypothetical protein